HGGFKECPNHHSHHFSSFPLLFVIPATFRHSHESGNPNHWAAEIFKSRPSFPHKRESKNKKSQKFNGRTEPRKSASRLRLNNRTKEAEIKTSGFFF
ncbi:hypothetical protein, partial [Neisseria meningitidis]|uniref:hypothetical protein n=1 Tax=Neisseria meningitidis TaxID=487 RepID=UPI001C8F7BD5